MSIASVRRVQTPGTMVQSVKRVGFVEELTPRQSMSGDRKLQPTMSLLTTPLHMACEEGNMDNVKAILKGSRLDVNTKDHSGSTPLHIAVRANHPHIVKFLMGRRVHIEVKDSLGETPLQVALNKGFSDILEILLDAGAEGLKIDTLPVLLRARGSNDDPDFFALRESGTKLFSIGRRSSQIALHSKNFLGINHADIPLREWKDKEWNVRSIYILNPRRRDLPTTTNIMTFSDPRTYLHGHDDMDSLPQVAVAEWAWLGKHKNGKFISQFFPGLPEQQQVLVGDLKPFMLIGHLSFEILTHDPRMTPIVSGDKEILSFQTEPRIIDVSWIMRRLPLVADREKTILRSMHFRGSLDLKYLSIPKNGAMFVNLFLGDVHDKWKVLIDSAKSHLSRVRISQFNSAGTDHTLIKCLLQDALHWNRFYTMLILHISTANDLLNTFKTNEVIFAELMQLHEPCSVDSDDESSVYESSDGSSFNYDGDVEYLHSRYRSTDHADGHVEVPDIEKVEAIKKLMKRIARFEEECTAGIRDLDKLTKEMIDLEFNLVSIFESRRSIDMSASMKRLSWITFIFLPLMFVSSLFGMNINLLATNPGWQWYLIIAGPTITLVLAVWIFCKYLPVTQWLQDTVGSRLESRFDYKPPQSITPSSHREDDGPPYISYRTSMGYQGSVSAVPRKMPLLPWVRYRRGRQRVDEEAGAVKSTLI